MDKPVIQFKSRGIWIDVNQPESFRIKPEKKRGWIGVYNGHTALASERDGVHGIYKTKEECLHNCPSANAHIEIEWESN